MRPEREQLHMLTAHMWAMRSLCGRLAVGCVITDKTMRQILSIGYNGPAKSLPHDRCRKDTPGGCGCLHAEQNAVAFVDSTIPNKCAFITHTPCEQCAQLLIQSNVVRVFYNQLYRDASGLDLLKSVNVFTQQVVIPTQLIYTMLRDTSVLPTRPAST